MKKTILCSTILILTALLSGACSASLTNTPDDGLKILSSTSFLADIAQNVAGDRAQVESLLPIGLDPHAYQPAPADLVMISESDVLILNGLEYEYFIESLIESADGERLVITASDGLTPRLLEAETHEEESASTESESGDPHMWLDPNLVVVYVENIRDGLSQADPTGADVYTTNASAYIAQLIELDTWIKEQVSSIPVERRLLVTNHESLGYFAERYGFTVVETILPSFSSESSASAKEIASAIEAIKSSGAPAIFLGEAENTALAEQIASETNVKVVDTLYLETLTDGAPAGTYLEMMKYNVTQIVDALK